jgi:class 3 adenylate cyclase
VRCGSALAAIAGRSKIPLRGGVHIGECHPATGAPVSDIAAAIAESAQPGQVLVSRPVVDLVPGSGLSFADGPGRRLVHSVTAVVVLPVS